MMREPRRTTRYDTLVPYTTRFRSALLLAACSGGAPRDTVVIIPPGASIAKAGEILEQAGTTSAAACVNHARFFGGDAPIKPGEYQVKKGMGAGDKIGRAHV